MTERRRSWFWGLSPGNVITLTVLCVGGVASYVQLDETVNYNSEQIREIRSDLKEVVRDTDRTVDSMEAAIKKQITASERRTREDIKDLKNEMYNLRSHVINNHK
jgi:hypothetical protein